MIQYYIVYHYNTIKYINYYSILQLYSVVYIYILGILIILYNKYIIVYLLYNYNIIYVHTQIYFISASQDKKKMYQNNNNNVSNNNIVIAIYTYLSQYFIYLSDGNSHSKLPVSPISLVCFSHDATTVWLIIEKLAIFKQGRFQYLDLFLGTHRPCLGLK